MDIAHQHSHCRSVILFACCLLLSVKRGDDLPVISSLVAIDETLEQTTVAKSFHRRSKLRQFRELHNGQRVKLSQVPLSRVTGPGFR